MKERILPRVDFKSELNENKPYFSFAVYVREKYGKRASRISIDTGKNCPHMLETGGCKFCSPHAYRPGYSSAVDGALTQWKRGLEKNKRCEIHYAYFQSGTNTPLDEQGLKPMIEALKGEKGLAGFIIGSRPDRLPDSDIDYLSSLAKEHEVWLELGLQSTNDDVLHRCRRGHSFRDFADAVERVEMRGNILSAAHVILGLPGESRESMLQGLERLNGLPISAVKFHHFQISRGSEFEAEHNSGPLPLWTEEGYIEFLIEVLERLSPDIVVSRLFAETHKDMLCAPAFPSGKDFLIQELRRRFFARKTCQGKIFLKKAKKNGQKLDNADLQDYTCIS